MKKILIVVLVVLVIITLSWAQEFFFQNWEIKDIFQSSSGLPQVILKNPDARASPSSVVVLVDPIRNVVLGYWYFSEIGEPKLFILEGGRYNERPDLATECQKCHKNL